MSSDSLFELVAIGVMFLAIGGIVALFWNDRKRAKKRKFLAQQQAAGALSTSSATSSDASNPVNETTIRLITRKLSLERTSRNGANWFFWIAAFSLINSIIYQSGGKLTFVVGLGLTQVVDGFATAFGKHNVAFSATYKLIGFFIDLGIAGVFVVFGIFGRKKFRWVVLAGMGLYVLDALIYLAVGDLLPVAFHAFALLGLWAGQKAMGALKEFEAPPSTSDLPALPQA